jgi:hypothetical protein
MPELVELQKAPEVNPPVAVGGAAYNRVVDLLNELRTIIGPNSHQAAGGVWFDQTGIVGRDDEFDGMITDRGPSGEPDFDSEDPRYWVVGANIDPAAASGTNYADDARVIFSEKSAADGTRRWVAATNTAEAAEGSHYLPVGTPVRVKRIPDGSMRWVFNSMALPTPEFMYMTLQGISQNRVGYEFDLLHPPVE